MKYISYTLALKAIGERSNWAGTNYSQVSYTYSAFRFRGLYAQHVSLQSKWSKHDFIAEAPFWLHVAFPRRINAVADMNICDWINIYPIPQDNEANRVQNNMSCVTERM